jgi:hypothetical protein
MTPPVGDPASTSALGGTLRTQAGQLVELVHDLARPAAAAERTGLDDPTAQERDLLTGAATELDRVGGLLQSWTTTEVETAARVRALEPELDRWDLLVEGNLVVDRPGPSRVDPNRRMVEREHLQELLNRATASRSRELARLARELERSTATLATVSDRARSGR